jgi:Transposase DNA-binding/Transposase Tn5 dimerisation domain
MSTLTQMLTAGQWARQQFGSVELGDKRRTKRAVKLAESAALAATASLPDMCGAWKNTKAAYRLLDRKPVTFQSLGQPHRRLTSQSAAACAVVLHVGDTTTLSFAYGGAEGLGPTGGSGRGRGMLLHSSGGFAFRTLAVDVGGGVDSPPQVLGLSAQQLWARQTGPAPAPESSKWATAIEAVGRPPPQSRQVHVGDCESDCWEALEACRSKRMGFALRACRPAGLSPCGPVALRACQDRRVIAGHVAADATAPQGGPATPVEATLFELLEKQPMPGGKSLWVRGRKDREARWARLAVSAMAVTLLAPRNWSDKPHRKDRPRPPAIACRAVRDPPAGEEPIEWVILTDQPVTDLETALEVVFWYSCRWLIEEYHKCLKTGCRAEERQLETADRLGALLGMLTVVAVRLLQLKHQARCDPERPAWQIVPERHVKVLAAHRGLKAEMTVHQFWRAVAQLGGFLARRSDGDPGWLTLWRGWQKLDLLVAGAEVGRTMRR